MSYLKEIVKDDCRLEMTPMIDVTFLLLIFFLLTIKFKTLEGKLAAYLPKDVGVNVDPAEPKEKLEIKLSVVNPGRRMSARNPGREWTAEEPGRFEYQGRVVRYAVGPRETTDLEVLQDRLKEHFRQDPTRPATIDPRAGTIYGDVVPVLDAVLDAGYNDITFVGEYKREMP